MVLDISPVKKLCEKRSMKWDKELPGSEPFSRQWSLALSWRRLPRWAKHHQNTELKPSKVVGAGVWALQALNTKRLFRNLHTSDRTFFCDLFVMCVWVLCFFIIIVVVVIIAFLITLVKLKSKCNTSAVWNLYHQTTDKLQEESWYISVTLKETFHIPCNMTLNPYI